MATGVDLDIQQLEHQIRYLEDQLELLRGQFAPLQEKYDQATQRIEALCEQRDTLKYLQMLDSGQMNWNWLVEEMPATKARRQACDEALGQFGLALAHYHRHTNQAVPQIRLIKDDPDSLARHLEGLKILLPYLKPSMDGAIVLPIMGNEQVGRFTWELKIKQGENSYLVTAHPLYRQRDHLFGTLEEALAYIQENLYWQTAE